MFAAILKEATGLFDKRFLLSSFFPVFIFAGAIFVIASSPDARIERSIEDWNASSDAFKVVTAVLFIAIVVVGATVASSMQLTILRVYEGYWIWPFGVFAGLGRSIYRQRRKSAIREELYSLYPPTLDIMPTRLGNMIRSAEAYPRLRYGIDAVLVWPRLFPLVKEDVSESLSQAKANLDLALLMSALSAALGVFSAVYLLANDAPWWFFLTCFGGSAVASWVTYEWGALTSAVSYCEQIRVAFDLNRNAVLDAMNIAAPANPREERELWKTVAGRIYTSGNEGSAIWKYKGAQPSPPTGPQQHDVTLRFRP